MDHKQLWRSLRTAPPAVQLGMMAFLTYSAKTACFGIFDMVWMLVSLLIAATAYSGTRHRYSGRLVIGLFAVANVANLGLLTYQVYLYGTVLVCPWGTSRASSGSDAVSCLQPDDVPLGPAMGTLFGGDGSTRDFYEEYRRLNGKIVGLRVTCNYPPYDLYEVCFPEANARRCEPARFEPPLAWKGCWDLSARVAEGFTRKCRTVTAPSEVCF